MLIRQRRESAHLTVDGLAKRAGCSKGLISQLENGKSIDGAGFGKIMAIAKILGIEPEEMTDLSRVYPEIRKPEKNLRNIPLFDYGYVIKVHNLTKSIVPSSRSGYAEQGRMEEGMPLVSIQGDLADSLSDHGYALKIEGTDNSPEYRENDQIIIDPDQIYHAGEMVVAFIEGHDAAILRKYRPRGKDSAGEVIELVPLNDDHATYTINKDNPGSILGVVVKHTRDPRIK